MTPAKCLATAHLGSAWQIIFSCSLIVNRNRLLVFSDILDATFGTCKNVELHDISFLFSFVLFLGHKAGKSF